MKEYNYKVKGVSYNVKINSIEENIAKVEVNGIGFDVELEKPVAQPKPVVRAVAAPVKTVEAPKEALEAVEAGVLAVRSPLPGTVNDIKVTVGQEVKAGETVVVLEAMKMENNIDAERGGKVLEIKVAKGDTVMEGAILITIG
ncbi:MAG: biotin/lipoyl-containing protein [Bacteroidaceae bacterium]|nr:biotin/lipoyl-binding protein [Bacteroidaceae bacterium]MDO5482677.1 biotin/lipoyl-containing protein [Bacteroidaceae bacterium]